MSNKGDEMGHTARMDEMGNSYKILNGKLEEKRPGGNIKTCVREIRGIEINV